MQRWNARKNCIKQTYAGSDDDSSSQEQVLVPGYPHTEGPHGKHDTGPHDHGPPPQTVIQEAPDRCKKGSSGHRDADNVLLPDERELELVSEENHRSRNHPRVISEQESPEGREKGQHVHKPGGTLLWRKTVNFQTQFLVVCFVVQTSRSSRAISSSPIWRPSQHFHFCLCNFFVYPPKKSQKIIPLVPPFSLGFPQCLRASEVHSDCYDTVPKPARSDSAWVRDLVIDRSCCQPKLASSGYWWYLES